MPARQRRCVLSYVAQLLLTRQSRARARTGAQAQRRADAVLSGYATRLSIAERSVADLEITGRSLQALTLVLRAASKPERDRAVQATLSPITDNGLRGEVDALLVRWQAYGFGSPSAANTELAAMRTMPLERLRDDVSDELTQAQADVQTLRTDGFTEVVSRREEILQTP